MSDKSIIVIMGASCVAGTMELYHSQLRAADIDFHVEPITDIPPLGFNLGFKIAWLRRFAQRFSEYEKIVFSDAWDVTFYGTKEDAIGKIPTDNVMFAAEKNCYPQEARAFVIPARGEHMYCNGGLSCGTPDSFITFCDQCEQHEFFDQYTLDQYFFNRLLSVNAPFMHIDHTTSLFFCLFCGYPELDFEKGIPVNRTYGAHPSFLHRNGGWSGAEMFWKYEQSLL